MIDTHQVAQFLKDNPDFFSQHTELLAALNVPHPHGDQAISIGERQVMLLRDRSRGLEMKLREFIQFAEENDAIGEKLHKLGLGLMRARNLDAALAALYLSLREDFAVPHAVMRLWDVDGAPDLAEFSMVSEDTRTSMADVTQPRCGHEISDEMRGWFNESGAHLKSFAIAPLHESNVRGVLVLASEDGKRFYPEMGTLYLTWLAALAAAALSRFLP